MELGLWEVHLRQQGLLCCPEARVETCSLPRGRAGSMAVPEAEASSQKVDEWPAPGPSSGHPTALRTEQGSAGTAVP